MDIYGHFMDSNDPLFYGLHQYLHQSMVTTPSMQHDSGAKLGPAKVGTTGGRWNKERPHHRSKALQPKYTGLRSATCNGRNSKMLVISSDIKWYQVISSDEELQHAATSVTKLWIKVGRLTSSRPMQEANLHLANWIMQGTCLTRCKKRIWLGHPCHLIQSWS